MTPSLVSITLGLLFYSAFVLSLLRNVVLAETLEEYKALSSGPHNDALTWMENDDDLTRAERFPSIEERVKVYMGNWYAVPCRDDDDNDHHLYLHPGWIDFYYQNSTAFGKGSTSATVWPSLVISHEPSMMADKNNESVPRPSFVIENVIEPDRVLYLDEQVLLDCLAGDKGGKDDKFRDRVLMRSNMLMYCYDAAGSLMTAVQHVAKEEQSFSATWESPPTLVQFGDLKHSHEYGDIAIPHFKKFRSATTPERLRLVTPNDGSCLNANHRALVTVHSQSKLQPIIWKFATFRHFRTLDKIYREDTPWEKKKPMAVFRGQLTGSRDGYRKRDPDLVNCMRLRRCRLVYAHAKSTLVDAKLTSTRNRMPDVLNNVTLTTSVSTIRRLLEYKAVIMLEGNDVASGLKWALLSQSVVLMPPPTHTSWAMEELLEPWVHYVPLNANATDVEEKMQWVLDNDYSARRIAERASLWMEDLCFHPDAALDDRLIQEEMIRRYNTHFALPSRLTPLEKTMQ